MFLRRIRFLRFTAISFLLAIGLTFHTLADDEESSPEIPPSEMKAKVSIVEAHAGQLPRTIRAFGLIAGRSQAPTRVVTRTGGIVRGVLVREGEAITSGTMVAELDPKIAQANLSKTHAGLTAARGELRRALNGGLDAEQAELDLTEAQAKLTVQQAEKEAARQKQLLADRLTSEKVLTNAQQALESAQMALKIAEQKGRTFRGSGRELEKSKLESAVAQAEAEQKLAEFDLESTRLRSPASGKIARLRVVSGQSLEAGATVAEIISNEMLVLRIETTVSDADEIAIGAPVLAAGRKKEAIPGRVSTIDAGVDPETGLVGIEALLDPIKSSFRVGEILPVTITTSMTASGIIVPASSLNAGEKGTTVLVVDDNNISRPVEVEVLGRSGSSAVVSGNGIADGCKVICDGNFNLPDGAHVEIK